MSFEKSFDKKAVDDALSREFGLGSFTWGDTLGGFSSRNIALTARDRPFILKQFGPAATKQVGRLEAIALFLREQNFAAPLPEATRTGLRHFSCEGKIYALFLRNPGFIRHSADLSDVALKNTAANLARLHLLKPSNAKTLLGSTRRNLHQQSSSLASDDVLCAKANEVQLEKKYIDTMLESLNVKRRLIDRSNHRKCVSLNHGNHFVHGDFHNENLLFDDNAQVVCFLDFEESFLGQGVLDVVNFVFMALCNDGISCKQLHIGRQFVNYYRSIIPTEPQLLETAIESYFLSMASSTFLENRLVEGQKLFGTLLRRDIEKMKTWDEEPLRIIRALL
jgi:Ser/Thr protein kinase RdoA (MazF antagonist)